MPELGSHGSVRGREVTRVPTAKVVRGQTDANDPTRTSASFEHSFEPHRLPRVALRRSAAINHTEASRGERATVGAHLRLLHDR